MVWFRSASGDICMTSFLCLVVLVHNNGLCLLALCQLYPFWLHVHFYCCVWLREQCVHVWFQFLCPHSRFFGPCPGIHVWVCFSAFPSLWYSRFLSRPFLWCRSTPLCAMHVASGQDAFHPLGGPLQRVRLFLPRLQAALSSYRHNLPLPLWLVYVW